MSRAALRKDLFVHRGGRQRRLGTTVWSHSVRMACITLAYKWFVGTQSDHMGSMHPEIAPIPNGRKSSTHAPDARLTTTSRRTARNSLPMNYFSRFHVHAGSRMVDAGAQTCTWSPVPRPVHRDRDPGPESRDARQFSLSARWGTLASSRGARSRRSEVAAPAWLQCLWRFSAPRGPLQVSSLPPPPLV